MQALAQGTDFAPPVGQYNHRSSSPRFQTPSAEELAEVIYLVDADPSARAEISSFLTGWGNCVFEAASADEYLNSSGSENAACVILSVWLPDLPGIELQKRIVRNGNPPVIFVGDHCDVASTVEAMKAGAIDFLTKPLDMLALCAAVRTALVQTRRLRQKRLELQPLEARLRSLTPREREVLPLIVGGLLNKQAASVLGISEVTLQIHRSQVMRKMKADSLASLVRMAVKLRIPYWLESKGRPIA